MKITRIFDDMTSKDYYIFHAIQQARKSNMRFKHGCVVVYNKKIISCGYNYHTQDYIDKVRRSSRITVHAEISACSKVPKHILSKCVIYVVRVRCDGSTANSKPCQNCKNYLIRHNVNRVYYSF